MLIPWRKGALSPCIHYTSWEDGGNLGDLGVVGRIGEICGEDMGDPSVLISLTGGINLAFFGIIPHYEAHGKIPTFPLLCLDPHALSCPDITAAPQKLQQGTKASAGDS